jgi:photosystem II biogenesis protein Psp29
VGDCQTVADSKRRFFAAYPRVIPGLYRRLVDELLVELHLLSHQQGFEPDALFSLGLTQVFDSFTKGFQPEGQRENLFQALCSATGLSNEVLRQQAGALKAGISAHGEQEISNWLASSGEGAPEPLKLVLQGANRSDFHYSRLHAVGLMALIQELSGGDDQEPEALRKRATSVGEQMGLQQEKLDKDMGLYASNLEKMAQAVEMMEETVAAVKRRRERQSSSSESPVT